MCADGVLYRCWDKVESFIWQCGQRGWIEDV